MFPIPGSLDFAVRCFTNCTEENSLTSNTHKSRKENKMEFFVGLVLSSFLLLISGDMTAITGAVKVENEKLLSSPNESNESQPKGEGEVEVTANPDVLNPSASGNKSNQGSVDQEKMAEVVQRVVQEVKKDEIEQTSMWDEIRKVMRKNTIIR